MPNATPGRRCDIRHRSAANTVRSLRRGVDDVLDAAGLAGLDRLPGIGQALARVIDQIVITGRRSPTPEGLRNVAAGASAVALRRGMDKALGAAVATIRERYCSPSPRS